MISHVLALGIMFGLVLRQFASLHAGDSRKRVCRAVGGFELRDRRGKRFSVLQFTRYVESSYSVHGLVQYLVLQGLYSYCSYHRKYPCYHCPNRHHNYNHCCPCVCRLCLEVASSWQALCTAVDIGQAWCGPQKTSLAIRVSLPSSATNSSRRKAAERFRQDACQIAGGEIVATWLSQLPRSARQDTANTRCGNRRLG